MNDATADSMAVRANKRLGMSRVVRERLLGVGMVVLWLLMWEFSIRWGLLDDRFFNPPSIIFNQFLAMWLYDYLGAHVAVSTQRLFVGYLLGTVPALLLGVVLWRSQWLRAGCGPLLIILASFPALAIYPVVMLIFGLGEWSKWIVVAVSTFFWMLYWMRATTAARVRPHPDLATGSVEAVTDIRTNPLVRHVQSIYFGLRLTAWVGLLTLLPAEFVGAKSGIGYVIWISWSSFHVAQMYVGIALAGTLGALAWLVIDLAERLTLALAARRVGLGR